MKFLEGYSIDNERDGNVMEQAHNRADEKEPPNRAPE